MMHSEGLFSSTSFDTESDHRMLRARTHEIPAVEKRALNVSSQNTRFVKGDEMETVLHIEAEP